MWSIRDIELQVTAFAYGGEALVEYRVTNRARRKKAGSLVLAVHPVQINPYWQHGGHAAINAISVEGKQVLVNDRCYGVLSHEPDFVAIADFDDGDVISLIEKGPTTDSAETPLGFRPSWRRARVLIFPREPR